MFRDPITGKKIINSIDGHLFPHINKTIKWKFHNNKKITTEETVDNYFGSKCESQLGIYLKQKNNKIQGRSNFQKISNLSTEFSFSKDRTLIQLHSKPTKYITDKIQESLHDGAIINLTYNVPDIYPQIAMLHSAFLHEAYHGYSHSSKTLDILNKIIDKKTLSDQDKIYVKNCVCFTSTMETLTEDLHYYSDSDHNVMFNETTNLNKNVGIIVIQPMIEQLINFFCNYNFIKANINFSRKQTFVSANLSLIQQIFPPQIFDLT